MKHIYETIEGWFDFEKLYSEMVSNSPKNTIAHFVEIGAYLGKSTSYMAVEILNSQKPIRFDVVDTWEGSAEHDKTVKDLEKEGKTLYSEFIKNVFPILPYLNPLKFNSVDASKFYGHETLDFIMIDGSHNYKDVKQDILNWYPKLKPCGVMAGHDFNIFLDVNKAVQEVFGDKFEKREGSLWYIRKG